MKRRGTREALRCWPSPKTPRGHSLRRASPPRAASHANLCSNSVSSSSSSSSLYRGILPPPFLIDCDLLFHVRQSTGTGGTGGYAEPIHGAARSSPQRRRQLVGHRQQVRRLAGSDFPPPRRALWIRHRYCSCTPLFTFEFRILNFSFSSYRF